MCWNNKSYIWQCVEITYSLKYSTNAYFNKMSNGSKQFETNYKDILYHFLNIINIEICRRIMYTCLIYWYIYIYIYIYIYRGYYPAIKSYLHYLSDFWWLNLHRNVLLVERARPICIFVQWIGHQKSDKYRLYDFIARQYTILLHFFVLT